MTIKVFVLNRYGQPLMLTSPRKARQLLKQGKAKIVQYDPFVTIQLLYGSSGYRQPIHLGTDPGYQTLGFSAMNAKDELLGRELNSSKGCQNESLLKNSIVVRDVSASDIANPDLKIVFEKRTG